MDSIYYGSIKISAIFYIAAALIAAFMFAVLKRMNQRYALLKALLFAYIFLVFSSTVLARPNQGYYDYNLKPFWSYDAIKNGHDDLLVEIIFNILMFIPIGFILPLFDRVRIVDVILTGICFSYTIEMCQLVFKKGFYEFDDIIHNTLGCIIGYFLYTILVKKIIKFFYCLK